MRKLYQQETTEHLNRKFYSIQNSPVVVGAPAVENIVMGKNYFLKMLEKEFKNDALKDLCADVDALVCKSFTDYYCDYHVMSEFIIYS